MAGFETLPPLLVRVDRPKVETGGARAPTPSVARSLSSGRPLVGPGGRATFPI